MSARNVSRLDHGLIARKGEASPAQANLQSTALLPTEQTAQEMISVGREKPPGRPTRGVQGTIAVTVRLDPDRYERMKVYGARRRQTNQDILVEALDRFFARLPD